MQLIESKIEKHKLILTEVVILLLIELAFLAMLFSPMLFEGKVMVKSENLFLHYPWRVHAINPLDIRGPFGRMNDTVYQDYTRKSLMFASVRAGELPLWNPWWLGGLPLAAEQNAGVFYPLNAIYYLVDPRYSFGWVGFVLLLCAGVSTYLFVRSYGVSVWGARIAALAYSLSPLLIVDLGFEGRLSPYAFVPAMLFLLRRWSEHEKLSYAIGCGVLLATQFLGDDFQMVWYLLLVLAIYLVSLGFGDFRSGKFKLREHIVLWGAVFGIGFAGGAIQILPSLETFPSVARSTPEGGYGWVPPSSLATLVLPRYYGYGPQEFQSEGMLEKRFLGTLTTRSAGTMMYVGLVPLLLAMVAASNARARRKVRGLIIAALAILAFLVSLPLYASFLSEIPILGGMYHYGRLRFVVVLVLCTLAGIGLDLLIEKEKPTIHRAKVIGVSLGTVVVLGALVLLAAVALFSALNKSAVHLLGVEPFLNSPIHFFWALVLLLGAIMLIVLFDKGRIGVTALGCLLVLWTGGDLVSLSVSSIPFTAPSELYPATESIRFLQSHTEPARNRVMTLEMDGKRTMVRGLLLPYGIVDTRGIGMMLSERWWSLLAFAEFGMDGINHTNKLSPTAHTLRGNNYRSPVYDALAVEYFIAPPGADVNDPKLSQVYTGDIDIYHNSRAMPRAYVVHKVYVREGRDNVFAEMARPDFDFHKEIVVEGYHGTIGEGQVAVPATEAQILEYTSNRVKVKVKTDVAGFLVLTDTYYPGWQADIDGQPAQVYPANYALRAVPVPAGEHIVTFEYRPWTLKLGAALTGACFLLVPVGLLVLARKPSEESPSR